MAIKDQDIKLLWGRAAGRCSNPACNADLTVILEDDPAYNVGEMAHIIAHAPGGPRGRIGGGSDTYDNLILLCPTCHRHVDKSPAGTFTEEQLLDWKRQAEERRQDQTKAPRFSSFEELKGAVARRLLENGQIARVIGPKSDIAARDPGSNAAQLWDLRKLSTIVPNNAFIVNAITANADLVPEAAFGVFLQFKDHAEAFERNQFSRLDFYPLFPDAFEKEFGVVEWLE